MTLSYRSSPLERLPERCRLTNLILHNRLLEPWSCLSQLPRPLTSTPNICAVRALHDPELLGYIGLLLENFVEASRRRGGDRICVGCRGRVFLGVWVIGRDGVFGGRVGACGDDGEALTDEEGGEASARGREHYG